MKNLTVISVVLVVVLVKYIFSAVKLTEKIIQFLRKALLQLSITMAELTQEDVLKLAKLARLDLSEVEIEEYRHELSEILRYVEQLQAIDVAGLKPTNQVSGLTNIMRDDRIKDYGYKVSELLKNVPEVQDDQIKVKRMVG